MKRWLHRAGAAVLAPAMLQPRAGLRFSLTSKETRGNHFARVRISGTGPSGGVNVTEFLGSRGVREALLQKRIGCAIYGEGRALR